MSEETRGLKSKSTTGDEAEVVHFDGIDHGPPARYDPAKDEVYYVLQPHVALIIFGFLGHRREAAKYIARPSGEYLFEALTYARAIGVVNPEFAKQVEERSDIMLKRGRAIHAHRACESGTEGRHAETSRRR